MDRSRNTHHIKLGGRKWWTGRCFSLVKTFAKAYTPERAAQIVAQRWSAKGARVLSDCRNRGDVVFITPTIAPILNDDDERTET